jgi:prephenate dehydrogenase
MTMTMQITIIGLGQIGSSVGLALGEYKARLKRVGHDKKIEVERAAQSKGAVDEIKHNLPAAVREARLVVLCLPVSQVRETLQAIAPELPEGAIVLDTSPAKKAVAGWAQEILPPRRYYVGLTPAIHAEALHDIHFGVEAARPDLFHKSVILMDAPAGTPGEVVSLAMDWVRLLGAQPVLTDTFEADGLTASMHLVPQLLAAALLNATVDQPGWQEARRIAGRPFAAVTAGLAYQDEIDSLRLAVLQNRENVVHMLDVVLAALRGLREDIEGGNDDGLAARLELALEGRNRWMRERMDATWEEKSQPLPELPSFAERFFGTAVVRRPGER